MQEKELAAINTQLILKHVYKLLHLIIFPETLWGNFAYGWFGGHFQLNSFLDVQSQA